MRLHIPLSAFFLTSLLLVAAAAAQTSLDPSIFLSSNEASFFNGDQDSIDATVTNNDVESHTFTISVFPGALDKVFADANLGHITLAPKESGAIKVTFSSLFEAEFVPREFSLTLAATDDSSISSMKEVVITILRRSPVFVLSLNTNKFSYQPGETMNASSVVANQGGDTFEDYKMQTVISRGGEFIKRFETQISYLPEKSKSTFSNLYTFDQFAEPGVYSAQLTLKDAKGQTLSVKSVNFRVGEVSRASQQESSSMGILESTTTVTSRNEGNSPADITVTALIPAFSKDFFASDIQPTEVEDVGNSIRVSWIFEDTDAGETVQVVYKFVLWKIWATIIIIVAVVYLAFKFVFTMRIIKRSRYLGPITKDTEVPVSIEIVNRSIHVAKDLTVRDFVPPIARVVQRFETVKPVIRESVAGTELIWKFDALRAGEERVMTYRVKPKMDVLGSLRLNPATLGFSNYKRQKKSVASGLVIVTTS